MLRVVLDAGERHLVRAPRAQHLHAVDDVRARPALRAAQHDHRPVRPYAVPLPRAGVRLDGADALPRRGQRLGEAVVHARQVGALDLDDVVAVALEELADLRGILAAEHGRSGDLRAVEVQDREHGAVALGVDERHALPRPLERAGLGLAVTHDGQRDEVRVVHDGAEGVHEHVAELATLVDRPRRRDRHVARDAARCGELAEEPADAVLVEPDGGELLGVGALEVAGGDERGAAVAGAGEVEHLLARRLDQARGVGIDEGQAGAGPPVAEQPWLDVGVVERTPQQRVGHEVDLTHRQVVVGAPPGVEAGQLLVGGPREALHQAGVGPCDGCVGRGHRDSPGPVLEESRTVEFDATGGSAPAHRGSATRPRSTWRPPCADPHLRIHRPGRSATLPTPRRGLPKSESAVCRAGKFRRHTTAIGPGCRRHLHPLQRRQ